TRKVTANLTAKVTVAAISVAVTLAVTQTVRSDTSQSTTEVGRVSRSSRLPSTRPPASPYWKATGHPMAQKFRALPQPRELFGRVVKNAADEFSHFHIRRGRG